MSRIGSLVVFLLITLAAASVGAIFKPGDWYMALAKPSWTPPPVVFPIVWPILYLLIAISGWLVWRRAGWSTAIVLWGVQLAVNASWSWWMFGQHNIFAAMITVDVLWLLIGAYVFTARPLNSTAAWLFMPYWAWVTFASLLNAAVWRMNG